MVGVSTSGVFRGGMAAADGLESLRRRGALELTHRIMTEQNARFLNETDYTFNMNSNSSQRMGTGHRNCIKTCFKKMRFAVTFGVPS